jgi:hypothetical protein
MGSGGRCTGYSRALGNGDFGISWINAISLTNRGDLILTPRILSFPSNWYFAAGKHWVRMFFQSALDQVSYPNALALGTSLLVAYVVVHSIYTLYFHPLAKFPGPFWAKLTVFPSWYHTRNQDRHIWLHRLQTQYGKQQMRIQFTRRARPDF